jgi:hypothetical protein
LILPCEYINSINILLVTGISPFNIKTGEVCGAGGNYSKAFGNKIVKMAEENK